ncbi:hypothetical protein ABZ078_16690 [Streptomyces sp. NPDC006385]|uniref:hypothetical protein n=1 Tax=Streptomyces sp. NPDC006385 TaxID=3156761 RepID=UPI0033A62BA2
MSTRWSLFSPARYSALPGMPFSGGNPDRYGFEVDLESGGRLAARAVVAASGTFGRQHRPALPGLEGFTGPVPHAADYRGPAPFARQRILGRDLHFWLARTGLDAAPLGRLARTAPTRLVIDDGRYRAALAQGAPDPRELFTGIDGAEVTWPDGTREEVDAILLATGYRPDLPYLAGLDGALDTAGHPRRRDGISLAHPGLAFVGLEWALAHLVRRVST